MFSLDESSNERDIELGVGEAFELRLPENPTTGFRWELVSNGGPACLLQGDHFEPGDRTPGRGGMHVWQFRVAQAGLAILTLCTSDHLSMRVSMPEGSGCAFTFMGKGPVRRKPARSRFSPLKLTVDLTVQPLKSVKNVVTSENSENGSKQ